MLGIFPKPLVSGAASDGRCGADALSDPVQSVNKRADSVCLCRQGSGVHPLTSKDVYAFSRVSSSEEDEGPSSLRSQLPLRRVLKHSTPLGASPSLRRRPAGPVPSHPAEGPEPGSPLPAHLSWDPPTPQAGLSSTAALQTPQLSSIWASRAASGQPGPNPDPQAPGEEPPTAASVTRRRQQRAESRGARSRPRPVGLPGIPTTARRRKRDLKKLATVMERVRQWEIRQLQNIEEATQHELTIEDD
ncbi:coiled-coil domain-containing protein 201-like [Phoca vitulina]|uniref:coiled-coil domain-containing protein 201-like n=1 Tax=Phoca vitulina TaxID=9720 RepID=UPI001395FBBA|nr:coiled-coil domain-containing protein 201-like [Phoca vitulina]